jgi:hypothetical protein
MTEDEEMLADMGQYRDKLISLADNAIARGLRPEMVVIPLLSTCLYICQREFGHQAVIELLEGHLASAREGGDYTPVPSVQ